MSDGAGEEASVGEQEDLPGSQPKRKGGRLGGRAARVLDGRDSWKWNSGAFRVLLGL